MGIGICDSDRSRNLRSASRLPSDLGVNLSYGGARQRGCSVIRFPGSSDGDRRSTARNGCATRSEERSPCSLAGLKTRHYNGTLALLAGGRQARWPGPFR